MNYDVVIVGGGIAGLTSAAYIAKSGRTVLVLEKEDAPGGLVNSFDFKGFRFDGGIRAIENSGIVDPMLRQLGLHVEFVPNPVTIGIEEEILRLVDRGSLKDYQSLLDHRFPERTADISAIMAEIARIMVYMDVLYGIDNPLFMDLKANPEYLKKTLLPWLFKYMTTIGKIDRLNAPIEDYLRRFTSDPTLVDMIAQHFFQRTPAFFALSYFSLYLDYRYPKGGTGRLVDALVDFIHTHGGEIRSRCNVVAVDPRKRQVKVIGGEIFGYRKLIWAADLRYFYSILDIEALPTRRTRKTVSARRAEVVDKIGGDSILTLYATVDLPAEFFGKISSPHFFYTPMKVGLGSIGAPPVERSELADWIGRYLDFTTYEISIPVLRDESLAPPGKTGLIISTLFDHALVRRISDEGWYEEFKETCAKRILDVLEASVYPGLQDRVIDRFVSTPLTLEKRTGNSNGAITGWAFTNPFVPAVSSMKKIARSFRTPVPDVFQAGQWTFSPSGLPISILTGKFASDQALKELKHAEK